MQAPGCGVENGGGARSGDEVRLEFLAEGEEGVGEEGSHEARSEPATPNCAPL